MEKSSKDKDELTLLEFWLAVIPKVLAFLLVVFMFYAHVYVKDIDYRWLAAPAILLGIDVFGFLKDKK